MKNDEVMLMLKVLDPGFREHCNEKITISREQFENIIADMFIDSDTSTAALIKVSEWSVKFWEKLRGYQDDKR